MKTAISLPDAEFERFERVAGTRGVSRSEFYRLAARKLADEWEESSELTRLADAALERSGQPVDEAFLRASGRSVIRSTEW